MTETATSPEHLMELFAKRVGNGDIDGVMDLYESEAVLQPAPGVLLAGTSWRSARTSPSRARPM